MKAAEFVNLKHGCMSVSDYIKKFKELSRFAPHMASRNELKVNQFLQGLKTEIYRDVQISAHKDMPYAEVADKALEAGEAELMVIRAQEIRKNIRQGEIQLLEEDLNQGIVEIKENDNRIKEKDKIPKSAKT